MQKEFEKGSSEWQFAKELWWFRQQYYAADNDEAFFEEMKVIGTMLYRKYKKTDMAEYVKKEIANHMEDVDRRWRKENEAKKK